MRVLRKKRAEGEPGKLEALTKASVDLAQVRPVVYCHTRLIGLLLTFAMIDAVGIPLTVASRTEKMSGLVQAHRFFSSLAELGVKQSGIEEKKLVMHMEFCAKTHGAAEQHVAQVLLSSVSPRHLLCVSTCVTSIIYFVFRVCKPPGRWQSVNLRSWLLLLRKGQPYLSFSHCCCPGTVVRLHIAFTTVQPRRSWVIYKSLVMLLSS